MVAKELKFDSLDQICVLVECDPEPFEVVVIEGICPLVLTGVKHRLVINIDLWFGVLPVEVDHLRIDLIEAFETEFAEVFIVVDMRHRQ